MADRRAQNKYYPPDWDPSKGSINTYVGQHPLRDRARKLDQGILIIRFEMPFNIWCDGCENHIGMGVRYNAEKKKAGMYYTTPIWSFRMKCHLCDNWMEIHTDPKNTEYVVVSGARRKQEDWDPEENGTLKLKDDSEAEQLASNPFYKLEHDLQDTKKGEEALPIITQLQLRSAKAWSDPFSNSQKLRKRFREDKKEREVIQKESDAFRDKKNLSIPILPASESDAKQATEVIFEENLLHTAEGRKAAIASGSIFGDSMQSPGMKRAKFSGIIKRPDPFTITKTSVTKAHSPLLAAAIRKRL
ncbi:hypothetical protein SeMB42_g01704 [Synchytrium endobioticum]|uniref:Uncharacterized protein n=1 Tax=Synchytrium endobioticum TaxID=286115 RepID=A0A507D267_9FUNG|nr:hypothetical protein SeLEV6574_g03885 [Synchytrium endobioticum]TPX52012.1 hypothetical protein SeMB42_g01704 [Synchytrium endobioticum]